MVFGGFESGYKEFGIEVRDCPGVGTFLFCGVDYVRMASM